MERREFIKLIDSIWKGEENIPWNILNEYPLQAKFIASLLKDRKKILEIFGQNMLGKKGGISGKGLPITIKILNRDENPALRKYVGCDNRWIVVYFGVCPELENFISVVLWPDESDTSQKCYQTIYEILHEERKALKFEGAYYLIPPNEIHPQRVEKLEIKKDDEIFYNWQYFPFIKDVGETLSRPISAVNYRKVLLRDKEGQLVEEYVAIRVTVGSIIDMKGNEIKVKVPFLFNTPHAFTFSLPYCNHMNLIEKGSLFYFLLIEYGGEKTKKVFLMENADIIDALAHTVSFELYRRFILSVSSDVYRRAIFPKHPIIGKFQKEDISELFAVCSLGEYRDIVRKYSSLIFNKVFSSEKIKNEEMLLYHIEDLGEHIFQTYLSPYFKIKDNKVYYFPSIFRHNSTNLYFCEKNFAINKLIRSYSLVNCREGLRPCL